MADIENLFPIVFCVLDRYWAQMTVCVNLFSMLFHQKGEHFLEKSSLYPSADRIWGTILKKTSAVPKNRRNLKKTWGTNHKKTSAVPKRPRRATGATINQAVPRGSLTKKLPQMRQPYKFNDLYSANSIHQRRCQPVSFQRPNLRPDGRHSLSALGRLGLRGLFFL